MLWSDPATGPQAFTPGVKTKGWGKNDRGTSHVFSQAIVKEFTEKHDIDLILRGHQVMDDGYEFFADRKLVTIFSAPNYCNEFDNAGAMLIVEDDLSCRFILQSPIEKSFQSWKNNNYNYNKKNNKDFKGKKNKRTY